MKKIHSLILFSIIFLIIIAFYFLITNEQKIEQFQTEFDRKCVLDVKQITEIKDVEEPKNQGVLPNETQFEDPKIVKNIKSKQKNIKKKVEKTNNFKKFLKKKEIQKKQIEKQKQQVKNEDRFKINKNDILNEIEDYDEKDEYLSYLNETSDSLSSYKPEDIIRYHHKLKQIKNYLKKPKSSNCYLSQDKNIEISLDNNLKQQIFSNVNDQSIKTLGLNQSVLLKPENKNELMPEAIFEYQKNPKKRVIDLEIFKENVLDKINQNEKPYESNFAELQNSEVSIFKKQKIQEVPYKDFYKILAFHKKKIDTFFYDFIKNPIYKKQY